MVAGVIAEVFERRRRGISYELGLRYIDLLIDEVQCKPDMPEWDDTKKSRLTTALEEEGLIYNALFFERGEKKEMLFIHPTAIYEMGKEVLRRRLGVTPPEEAEIGHRFLCEKWEEKMERFFIKKWISPAVSWASEIAYANVIGWIHYLERSLEKGQALFFTPHLRLLKNDLLKNSLKKVAEEYKFSIKFFCFSESLRECGSVENFTFYVISKDTPWAELLRAIIFEDENEKPLFGLLAHKQPKKYESYTATIYCGMENDLRRIKKDIEKVRRDYVETIVPKFPEET